MATKGNDLSTYDPAIIPSGMGKKIGIVVSEWNTEITDGLRDGAIAALMDCGVFQRDIIIEPVPGAFELPLAAKLLIEGNSVDAVIAIGCVIRGETAHFDYVCQGVTQGIQALNLSSGKPVMFCVLTDDKLKQSKARSGGKHGNKGVEAAIGALKMLNLSDRLKK
jgi:6,7-dimethyl-8-ribityllumazine synthase|tara:strand:+ start:1736 stop:2230 length:495 start_codon:yes stop_codon:yes gene_type:complete